MTTDQLFTHCKHQAKALLEEFGEFYPFSFGLTTAGVIVPVDQYDGNEYPSSEEVIAGLYHALKIAGQNRRFMAVMICVDIRTNIPGSEIMIDALQLRCYQREQASMYQYASYVLTEGKVHFGEEFWEFNNSEFFDD